MLAICFFVKWFVVENNGNGKSHVLDALTLFSWWFFCFVKKKMNGHTRNTKKKKNSNGLSLKYYVFACWARIYAYTTYIIHTNINTTLYAAILFQYLLETIRTAHIRIPYRTSCSFHPLLLLFVYCSKIFGISFVMSLICNISYS